MFIDWLVVSIFAFLFWFILGKTLKTSELGIVSTSINFIILVSIFSTLGINNALQKIIPELKRKK
ncbi:MAG: oligosaccharide flippase family protein, partial [Asgard group archaeon]